MYKSFFYVDKQASHFVDCYNHYRQPDKTGDVTELICSINLRYFLNQNSIKVLNTGYEYFSSLFNISDKYGL